MEKITIEKPKRLTTRNVIYWMEKEGIMVGDMKHKALKFIEYRCIQPADGGWDVLPIAGYNITTHKIRNGKCTCQYNKKYDKECSHLIAIKLWQFQEKWNGN